jgi:hypothetical protein
VKNIQQHSGLEQLHYGEGSVIELRGPSAQILTLQGVGPQLIQWAPDDYRVLDVEVRMQLLEFNPFDINVPTAPPLVTFSLRFGHGRQTFTLPFLPGYLGGVAALTTFNDYTLTHRGHVLRLTARELQLRLQCLQDTGFGANPYTTVKVAVSFAPTHSMCGDSMPRQHVGTGFNFNQFPPEAREWRLSNVQGLPYAAAVATVDIIDIANRPIVLGADAAQWANFQAIPQFAYFWGSQANFLQATFR